MHALTAALAALLFVAPASADLTWGPIQDEGVQVVGLGAVEDGALLTHQNLELAVTAPGLSFASQTMHDHDAFFWFLTQPAAAGTWTAEATGPAGDARRELSVGPTPSTGGAARMDDGSLYIEHAGDAYWHVTDAAGDLVAAGFVAGPSADHVFFAAGRDDLMAHVDLFDNAGATRVSVPYVAPEDPEPSLIDQILGLLLPGEGQTLPAQPPCTDLLQEPAGDWYVDTHVRVGLGVADALTGSGRPQPIAYMLADPDGNPVLGVATNDPYGHAILRAPASGAYRLVVDDQGTQCEMPVNVMASEGSTPPIWDATPTADGIHVEFTVDSTAHYDVEAIVRDVDTGRIAYAGKVHSHGGGIKADLGLPPGTYQVDLFAVAQGPGPTVDAPMQAIVTVAPAADGAEAASVPVLLAGAALAAALLIGRRTP